MEGVDAILQEYVSLSDESPKSIPIMRLYKSKNFVSCHDTMISRHNTVVSRHDTTISRRATVLYITILTIRIRILRLNHLSVIITMDERRNTYRITTPTTSFS